MLRKDRTPQETIASCRSILNSLGLTPIESEWNDFEGLCYSVNLQVAECPFQAARRWRGTFFSNGKGTDRASALASAYGEYLERLQNLCSTPASFGLMPEHVHPPDATDIRLDSLMTTVPDVMGRLVTPADVSALGAAPLTCVPYFNVSTSRVVSLPDRLLFDATRSTGMCGGNSPEEALVQGFCEIFERYVVRRVLTEDDLVLPTIPFSSFEHIPAAGLIARLREYGVRVVVKDCSLGGRLPVIAVVLFHPGTASYRVKWGSDPSFEIALERCFTEIFQGVPQKGIGQSFKLIRWANGHRCTFRQLVNTGPSHCIAALLNGGGPPRHEEAFVAGEISNRTALSRVMKVVGDLAVTAYVRDVSFLGFPAYRVYMPGLSDNDAEYARHALVNQHRLATARRVLLGVQASTGEEIDECRSCLRELEERRFLGDEVSMFDIAGVDADPSSGFSKLMETGLFLGLLDLMRGDGVGATRRIEDILRRRGARIGNAPYYWCLVAYLKLQGGSPNATRVSEALTLLFGREVAEEVITDVSDVREALRKLPLPQCGDCARCPMSADCAYDSWREWSAKISARMAANPIDQQRLQGVFAI